MIPKKIHFIWLGGRPKSKLTEVCINSWRRCLPEYEIKEWNENNLDIRELCKNNKFFSKCYELKLWAFVSDYLRLWILYKEGGIYLDTDVEVIKSFNPLLNNKIFMGYEIDDFIGTATIGAEPGNNLIKRLIDFYNNDIWKVDFVNNPIIFKFLQNQEPFVFNECKVYPKDYFSPYIPRKKYQEIVEKKETFTIHWYTQNWNMSLKGYIFVNTKHITNPLKRIIEIIRKSIGYYKLKNS